ncbi:MAG: hypothetical protein AAF627_00875 [Myxococcota bacterium]
MLAPVLIRSIFRVAVVVIVGGALVCGGLFGLGMALGFAAGGAVSAASGLGMVWLVGWMLQPGAGSKGFAAVLLGGKLIAVVALAWLGMAWTDPLGFTFGLGAGVFSVVAGAQLGQASEAGQAAIEAEEAEAKRRDRDSESR